MGILILNPGDRFKRIERELGTRGNVFICFCRHGRFLLIAQRLPAIPAVINQLVTKDIDRVSSQSLYRLANRQLQKNQTKGYLLVVKPIEEAVSELNKLLSEHSFLQAGVVTNVEVCYRIARGQRVDDKIDSAK